MHPQFAVHSLISCARCFAHFVSTFIFKNLRSKYVFLTSGSSGRSSKASVFFGAMKSYFFHCGLVRAKLQVKLTLFYCLLRIHIWWIQTCWCCKYWLLQILSMQHNSRLPYYTLIQHVIKHSNDTLIFVEYPISVATKQFLQSHQCQITRQGFFHLVSVIMKLPMIRRRTVHFGSTVLYRQLVRYQILQGDATTFTSDKNIDIQSVQWPTTRSVFMERNLKYFWAEKMKE